MKPAWPAVEAIEKEEVFTLPKSGSFQFALTQDFFPAQEACDSDCSTWQIPRLDTYQQVFEMYLVLPGICHAIFEIVFANFASQYLYI